MGRLDLDIRGKVVPPDVIAAIAGRQHGVLARRQLFEAGVTRATVDRLVGSGWLHPLHRGVYAAGHKGVGPRGREMAAVLWAGAGHAVGRRSAAAMWAALPPWRGDVQLVGDRSKRTRGVAAHKARSLAPSDVTRHYGIPVTTPARTLIDLATVVDLATLEDALAEMQIRGLVRPETLIPRATGALAEALGAAEPTRSRLERAFRRFVREHGLPPPVINGFVEGYEVDAHWPDARLVVEVDGWRYHSTRAAFEDDRERDAVLQAAGWRVVRVTARQLHARTAERIRRLVRATGPRPRT
jgi:very-short-patch-repair endonuclease